MHRRAPCAWHSVAAAATSMSSIPPVSGSSVIGTTSLPPCTLAPQIEFWVEAGFPSVVARGAHVLLVPSSQQRRPVLVVTSVASLQRVRTAPVPHPSTCH